MHGNYAGRRARVHVQSSRAILEQRRMALPQQPFSSVAHVATECIEVADRTAELFPEERALIERGVQKRREQFSSGRVAAHRLFARSGAAPMPVLRGEGRAPRWPAGWVGSISHGARYALAALASADRIAGVGIDVEARGRLNAKMLRLIMTPHEIARIGNDLDRALIAFSAKESLYKALHPRVGVYIGFQEVEIDLEGDEFRARYRGARAFSALVAACRGYTLGDDEAVATLVVLEDAPSAAL
jgi:enterobactin synthetase component D / holo-[acyl-carrier protein] synthase